MQMAKKGHQLQLLSQQKGQDPALMGSYGYHKSVGDGAWIYVIDGGFDSSHPELDSTTVRDVKMYVPPNVVGLPKLTPKEVADGWEEGDELIDDKNTDNRHGTRVAGIAAGQEWGVAPKANLFLIKDVSYFINKRTGEVRRASGSTAVLMDIFDVIVDSATNDPDMYACFSTTPLSPPPHNNHPANRLFAATRRNV